MKILQFGRFHRRNFGGIERHVEALSAGLSGHATVHNVVTDDGWRSAPGDATTVETHRVSSMGVLAGVAVAPSFPLYVRRLWARERFDIAHLHFPDPLSHLAAELLPSDALLVVTWHSDIIRQRRLLIAYQPFLNSFLKRVNAVVAATPKHFERSRQLDAVKDSGKCRVIPYGLDAGLFAATAGLLVKAASIRASLPSPASCVIFSIGRHVYYKGFEYLIRAMREVDAVLVLGGTGPLLEEHRRMAVECGVAHKVVFPGRIEERDLAAYYHAADMFCLPSCEQSEAFGLVQLEAMACAKPIVNCDLGNGVNYVAPDGVCAVTVPVREPTQLARALGGLLQDPHRRRSLGSAGLERVRQYFTIDRMVASHLALYRELIGQRAQP